MTQSNKAPTQRPGAPQKRPTKPINVHPAIHEHPAVQLIAQMQLYRFSWPRLLSANVGLSIALSVSIAFNVVLGTREREDRYFATDPSGRITQLVPLDQPLLANEAVEQFAQTCISRSFSLTFVPNELKAKLNSLHNCYSDAGFNALMAAFDSSNLIQKIRDGRMVSSAVGTGAPLVTSVNPKARGGYMWTVQQPITITLANQTAQRSYPFIVESDIQRVSNVDNPKAVTIIAVRLMPVDNSTGFN